MSTCAGVHEKGTFSLADALKETRAKTSFQKAGAIATFVGVVRGVNSKDEKVQRLELEAYEDKANETLKCICRDLTKREGIVDVQIHHLVGQFEVGEDLVYVLVAGAHRKQVFSTLEEAVERYKSEAPIFKKEHVQTKNGETRAHWVSEGHGSSEV